MNRIKVTSIIVKKYRIVCLVEIFDKKYSDLQMKEKLLELFPSLAHHHCKNANNESFESLMAKTSLAHIFEHLVIDLQIKFRNEYKGASNEALFGTSEWLDESSGKAKVEVSYFDDLVALRAIKDAQEIINSL